MSLDHPYTAVRATAARLKRFTLDEVCAELEVATYRDTARVRSAIYELVRGGSARTVSRGEYEFLCAGRRTLMDKIWQAVRIRKSFSAEDIEFLTGASRATVLEYLGCLKDLGLLRKSGHTVWMLVKDTGPEAPVNAAKCKRLAELRRAKNGQGTRGQG